MEETTLGTFPVPISQRELLTGGFGINDYKALEAIGCLKHSGREGGRPLDVFICAQCVQSLAEAGQGGKAAPDAEELPSRAQTRPL